MDLAMMGLSAGTLWLLAGVFVIAIGVRCLPIDLHRPGLAGPLNVLADVALIVVGLLMVVGA